MFSSVSLALIIVATFAGCAFTLAQTNTNPSPNGTLFIMGIYNKGPGDPNFGQGFPQGYTVNSENAPVLTLQAGNTYIFDVTQVPPIHPLYLTTSAVGGQSTGEGHAGGGTPLNFTFVAPSSYVGTDIYYQCDNHQYMGNKIITIASVNTASSSSSTGIFPVSSSSSSSPDVMMTSSSSTASSSSSTATVGPPLCSTQYPDGYIFNVTVGSKTPSNPFYGLGYPAAYHIDSVEAPTLHLVRGYTYKFQSVNISNIHPFHVTTGSTGAGDGESLSPVTYNGLAPITYQADPDGTGTTTLYYQCLYHQYMGADILISDAGEGCETDSNAGSHYSATFMALFCLFAALLF